MNLYTLIEKIKEISLLQPNIKTAEEGSIYQIMNANPSIDYGVVVLTQGQHTIQDNFLEVGLTLFVIDRLMDDESNRLQIQSTAIEIIRNIIYALEEEDIDVTSNTINVFSEKFQDQCAGAYASLRISIPLDGICNVDF